MSETGGEFVFLDPERTVTPVGHRVNPIAVMCAGCGNVHGIQLALEVVAEWADEERQVPKTSFHLLLDPDYARTLARDLEVNADGAEHMVVPSIHEPSHEERSKGGTPGAEEAP